MKKLALILTMTGLSVLAAPKTQTFTGVITDTMCGANHEPMHVTPNSKCVRECVKLDPAKYKYALYDGKNVYTLSNQKTPEAFAAEKVQITGTLDSDSKVIQVEKIERAD